MDDSIGFSGEGPLPFAITLKLCRYSPMLGHQLHRPSDLRMTYAANTARQTRENRTITVDFQNEATYLQLLGDGKAFVECVIACILSFGFQLKHKAMCRGGGWGSRSKRTKNNAPYMHGPW